MSTKNALSLNESIPHIRSALYPDNEKLEWRYFAPDTTRVMRVAASERVFRSLPSTSSVDGYIELSTKAFCMEDEDVSNFCNQNVAMQRFRTARMTSTIRLWAWRSMSA